MVMEKTRRAGLNWQRIGLRVAGARRLAVTGAIHLDLYLTGYRSIPTIGGLFLFQVIAAFGLAATVLVSSGRLVSVAGAVFALSTLGGYLLSLRVGLFGFREIRNTAGIAAGAIEVATFAVLAGNALLSRPTRRPAGPEAPANRTLERLLRAFPGPGRAVAMLSVAAAVLFGLSLAAAGPTSATSSGALLKVATIRGVPVVTNSRGLTLYWFAPDTPTKSSCNNTCAVYWPPVIGTPTATPGLPGKLGTITRSDGTTQATYDGHPLYTYISDSSPGQANGNDINLNGGLWYEMAASG
jgi:predicted lipoprotein with Yx(FWY)xxD motif